MSNTITLSLDPEDLLKVEHDGLRVTLHLRPAKVPVGHIGLLKVEGSNGDKASLRINSLGKLFLQDAGASSTVSPPRERK